MRGSWKYPLKTFRGGCALTLGIEVLIIIVAVTIFLVTTAADYDGTCIRWDGAVPGETCTLREYLTQASAVGFLFVFFYYWWLVLSLLVAPLIFGALAGLLGSRRKGEGLSHEG